jgi:Mrp family chromosome partitioning ATPase
LALIPAGEGAPADFTLIVAVALSRTGMVHVGSPIQVADATQVPLNQLTAFLSELRRCTVNGDRVLVALPPATSSPITSAIAQSVDAALLCILLERMLSSQAKRTVKQLGASRFLGSAIFHPSQLAQVK